MSARACRRVLWALFAFTIPLPFFLVEVGRVPAARVLMLGGIALSVIVVEGSEGAVGIAAALLLTQGIGYLSLLWLVAYGTSRVLASGSRKATAFATVSVVITIVLVASAFEIYRTPFSAQSLHASLSQVYK